MFLFIESILFIFIVFFDNPLVQWLSIALCFIMSIIQHQGYHELGIIVIADIFLLNYCYIEIGVFLFMIVQCLYHQRLMNKNSFYYLLWVILFWDVYVLGFVYAMMSLYNLWIAFQKHHWLLITLFLLGLCDLCVAIQFLFSIELKMIWLFYLPSQVYFIKKVSSS